jgi:hypothetical protein
MAEVQPLANKLLGINIDIKPVCQFAAVSMLVLFYLIVDLD